MRNLPVERLPCGTGIASEEPREFGARDLRTSGKNQTRCAAVSPGAPIITASFSEGIRARSGVIEVTREADQPSARDHPDGPLQPFADGKPCTLIEHGTVTLP